MPRAKTVKKQTVIAKGAAELICPVVEESQPDRTTPATGSVNLKSKRLQNQMMRIGKPQLGEPFCRTGNVIAEYCIVLQKSTVTSLHEAVVLALDFYPLRGAALHYFASPHLVLFHETVRELGERFAHPQLVGADPFHCKHWQEVEFDILSASPPDWGMIESTDDGIQFGHDYDPDTAPNVMDPHDFRQRLEAALAPNVIESPDHPLIQRLLAGCGRGDDDYQQEWGAVA